MQHLPAYVAASRFVKGRRVLVVRPLSAAGPRLLLAAGAREVVACGGDVDPEPGLERVEGSWVDLPVRDQSVDLVLAIEARLNDCTETLQIAFPYWTIEPIVQLLSSRLKPGPEDMPDIPTEILDPRGTWADPDAYDRRAAELARMFEANFAQYADGVSEAIRSAGPRVV